MYTTIIVHIDGSQRQDSRLRAATILANDYGAHLIGSAVTGATWLSYAVLGGAVDAGVIEADLERLRLAAAERLEQFERQARSYGVASFESRLVEDETRDALLLQSRYADLLVVSQDIDRDPRLPSRVAGLPEHLALRGTRPVLVVPDNYRGQSLTGRIVVGWDGGAQATRAITAAMPLLKRAEAVTLALVNPDALSELHGDDPGADMALHLARHGVKVDVRVDRVRTGAGEALLKLACDTDAGLIVAGAYGHSRYREWALGGVTRDLLEWSHVPLLMAH